MDFLPQPIPTSSKLPSTAEKETVDTSNDISTFLSPIDIETNFFILLLKYYLISDNVKMYTNFFHSLKQSKIKYNQELKTNGRKMTSLQQIMYYDKINKLNDNIKMIKTLLQYYQIELTKCIDTIHLYKNQINEMCNNPFTPELNRQIQNIHNFDKDMEFLFSKNKEIKENIENNILINPLYQFMNMDSIISDFNLYPTNMNNISSSSNSPPINMNNNPFDFSLHSMNMNNNVHDSLLQAMIMNNVGYDSSSNLMGLDNITYNFSSLPLPLNMSTDSTFQSMNINK